MPGKGSAIVDRIKAGLAATFWSRLNAVDFMDSAFVLALLLLISLLPFGAVLAAATGRDFRRTIISRLGLNPQAAKDVNGLISSGHHAAATLTVLGAIILVLGAIGIAGTLQGWYQKIYNQPAPHGAVKQFVHQFVWTAVLVAFVGLEALVGRQVGPAGGHVLIFVCEFAIAVVFWWWTVHWLLLGTIGWRALFPAGVATAFCLTGLSVFSSLLFSGSIISGEQSYGPVGVLLVLVAYLIGVGVCLNLGAVFGCMWSEHHSRGTPPPAQSPRRPQRSGN